MAVPMPEEMHEYVLGYVHATAYALKVLIDTLPDTERAMFNERFESTEDTVAEISRQLKIDSYYVKKGFDDAAGMYRPDRRTSS